MPSVGKVKIKTVPKGPSAGIRTAGGGVQKEADRGLAGAQDGPPLGLAGQSGTHNKWWWPACGLHLESPRQQIEGPGNEKSTSRPLQSMLKTLTHSQYLHSLSPHCSSRS